MNNNFNVSTLAVVIEANEQGRDFIVGDIHGHKKRFLRALKSVNFDKTKDRLFCTGDLIDRGKDNLFILDCLREDWFFAIRGNHEQMVINRYELPLIAPDSLNPDVKTKFDAAENHQLNGGRWFDNLRSSLAKRRIYQNLSVLPYAITLQTKFGDIGLVHAEVPEPLESWSEFLKALASDAEMREEAIWNCVAIDSIYHVAKLKYWEAEFQDEPRFIKDIVMTVHGHSFSHEPIVHGNQVWIDTGQITDELTILEASQLVAMIEKES